MHSQTNKINSLGVVCLIQSSAVGRAIPASCWEARSTRPSPVCVGCEGRKVMGAFISPFSPFFLLGGMKGWEGSGGEPSCAVEGGNTAHAGAMSC